MASYTLGENVLEKAVRLWKIGVKEEVTAIGKGAEAVKAEAGKAVTVVKTGVKTVLSTTKKILDAAGETALGAGKTVKSLPLILGILAVGVAGYLIFAGKKGTDLTQFIPRPRMPK